MLHSIRHFLNKHHRGLILIVMLFLTAQTCDVLICGSSRVFECATPRRAEGTEIATSLSVQPGTSSVGEVAVLNYAVSLTGANRITYASEIVLNLPPGVEFVQPVQPVFTTDRNVCTLTASTTSSLQMAYQGEPCPMSVNIRSTRIGSFALEAILRLRELRVEGFYSERTHEYSSEATFTVTGSIFVTKQFNPAEVKQGESSTMTIALTNDSTIPVTGVRFDDPMPAGMTLLLVTSNTCPGSSISTADNRLVFREGSLGANASCQIIATVRGDGGGLLLNTTSFVSAVEFNYSNQGQASLNVLVPTSTPLPPPPPEEPSGPVCGNLMCEPGETVASCERDCG